MRVYSWHKFKHFTARLSPMIAVTVHQEGLIYRNNFRVHLTVALDLSFDWQVIFPTRQFALRIVTSDESFIKSLDLSFLTDYAEQ